VEQLADPRRRFALSPEEFRRLNPNTLTCPVFRSTRDAELTKKLYRAAPVLIDDARPDGNPWGIRFMAMLHMSNDSHLFADAPGAGRLPLYEGKMVQAYDHRAASVEVNTANIVRAGQPKSTLLSEHRNPSFSVRPQSWIDRKEVNDRLGDWRSAWMIAFKSVTSPSNERTFIASLVPECGLANSLIGILPLVNDISRVACLFANLNAIAFDYVARNKVGGVNLNFF
ncbi:type II DNA modification enzyme, partial [mine drainage metagenome]